ncbi:hypothetical protein [Pseudomonas sp. TH10]|uniref:hypothetical protein n=1 Tax=Pseudomonas sp. TH10 TaxID=2796376 RepID=UPI001913F0CD|nr:hypothetical protein [Pseudomonas sp. TH10]MBK5516693.1 hypothetical protein [Pseudomonas sp. TH10]
MIELLKSKIGLLHGAELEKFVRRLLPTVSSDYECLTDTLNYLGRVTKGPVDLLAYKKADDRYIAVLCSGQGPGLKVKILDDIEKLQRKDCEIRDKIDEVVICVSASVGTSEAIFRKACARHGWASTTYSLDRLAYLANESPEITEALCAVEISAVRKRLDAEQKPLPIADPSETKKRFYNCGIRVIAVRTSLSMSPSQFVDLIDYDSEQRLGYLESETIEMSQAEIASVCKATGVCAEWLTHGERDMFSVESISTYHWEQMKWLKDACPASVHVLINDKTQQLVVLAHMHSKNWKIYSVVFDINFAAWWGDHHQIPEVYDMLKQLADDYRERIYGRVIGPKEHADILSGQTHPALFMKKTNAAGTNWFDDIFDYDHKYPIAENYEGWYGSWFTTAQDFFSRLVPGTSASNLAEAQGSK